MFDLGGGLVQHLIRGFHPRIHRRAAAGVQGVDGVLDGFGFQGAAQLAGDKGTAVKADHADLVTRSQQFDGGLGRLTGQMDGVPLHAARFVNDQDHGQGRLLLFLFIATGQRQDFFDGGFIVASQAEAVVRAEHGQTATEVRDIALHHLHLAGREIGRRDIGEDQGVEGQQGLEAVGHAMGRADVHFQALLFEGPPEGAELSRLLVQHENTGLATHRDGTVEPVVDGKTVLSGDQLGAPMGGPGSGHFHVHRDGVVTVGVQGDDLLTDHHGAVQYSQSGGHAGIGGKFGGKSNDFAFKGLGGVGSERFDAGLGIAQTVEFAEVYIDLLLLQCGQGSRHRADGLAAVCKEADASCLGRRKTESHR